MANNRKRPGDKILRPLLARSGNECAFPACTHPLFNEFDELVGELAHIAAYSLGGPRYDPKQTEEERNGYGNLVFLCHRHHVETHHSGRWPVEQLQKIKAEHEARFKEHPFRVTDNQINQIQMDMDRYWLETKTLHESGHAAAEFKMEIDFSSSYSNLVDEVSESVRNLCECVSGCIPKEKHMDYFDLFYLAIPNHANRITLLLQQMELMYLQEYLKYNGGTGPLRERFERLKMEFKLNAQSMGHVD